MKKKRILNMKTKQILYKNNLQTNYHKNSFYISASKNGFKSNNLISLFKKLNKRIIFVEGGGYTISNFYKQLCCNFMPKKFDFKF